MEGCGVDCEKGWKLSRRRLDVQYLASGCTCRRGIDQDIGRAGHQLTPAVYLLTLLHLMRLQPFVLSSPTSRSF